MMDMFKAIRGRGVCCQSCTGSWKARRQNKRARRIQIAALIRSESEGLFR